MTRWVLSAVCATGRRSLYDGCCYGRCGPFRSGGGWVNGGWGLDLRLRSLGHSIELYVKPLYGRELDGR